MRNFLLLSMALYIGVTTVMDNSSNSQTFNSLVNSATIHKTDIMKMDRALERHMHKVRHDARVMEMKVKSALRSI